MSIQPIQISFNQFKILKTVLLKLFSNIFFTQDDQWKNVDSGKLQKRIQQFKNETKDRAMKSKRKNYEHIV